MSEHDTDPSTSSENSGAKQQQQQQQVAVIDTNEDSLELIELYNNVRWALDNPDKVEIQEETMRAVLKFLVDPESQLDHWFCKSKRLVHVAMFSLLAFSFNDNIPILIQYRKQLGKMLNGCFRCAREYHIQILTIRKIVLENFGYEEDVGNEFMMSINTWNVDRLMSHFKDAQQSVAGLEQLKPRNFAPYFDSFFECLCSPRTLLYPANQELLTLFKTLFMSFQTPTNPTLRASWLLPTFIPFLFGTDVEFHVYTRTTLYRISEEDVSTAENFDPMLCAAMDDVVSQFFSQQRSQQELRKFWYSFDVLLSKVDGSVLKVHLAGRDNDILRHLTSNILKNPTESLPSALRALVSVIKKLGKDTWEVLSPVKPQVLVTAITSNKFLKSPEAWLDAPASGPADYPQKLTDVIDWIVPLLQSCDKTCLQKSAQLILPVLMDRVSYFRDKEQEEIIFNVALDIMLLCLRSDPRPKLPFIFQVERLVKQDVKILCYKYAYSILEASKRYLDIDTNVCKKAYEIIYYSISLDVIAGNPESTALKNINSYDGEIPPASIPSLWTQLLRSFPHDSTMAIYVLRAICRVTFIARPPPRKPEETSIVPKGSLSETAINQASQSMRTIGTFDSEMLKPVIKDRPALLSIFLNMFAANEDVNQSASDILCQAFDSDDRLNALQEMLNCDFKLTLKVLAEAFQLVHEVAIFSPCPKLIKVAQDVSQCLFGASNSLLVKRKSDLSQLEESELLEYWVSIWNLLERTFGKTPKWSASFRSDFMLEFLRDLLDYSGDLVEYFFLVVDALIPPNTDQAAKDKFSNELLQPVIKCLIQMCELLRLKDESLINTCFNIIISVMDLMKQFNIKPSRDLVAIFIKLAGRARTFENELSSEQKIKLLVASGEFTPEDAERVLGSKSETPTNDEIVQTSVKPSSYSSTDSHSNAKFKQTSMMDFAKPDVGPKLPSSLALLQKHGVTQAKFGNEHTVGISAPKSSMMEALRANLKAQKSTGSKPAIAPKDIHPARPPGFSEKFGRAAAVAAASKKKSPTKSAHTGHSSSDEDSSASEGEDGLFTAKEELKSKHKLRNIEKKSSSFGVSTSRTKIASLSDLEREKRNMTARLQVDLDPLYKQVLSWDYHSTSNYPKKLFKGVPGTERNTTDDNDDKYTPVPSSFKTVADYNKVFEPLLMLECWQGIVKNKEESTEAPFKIVVASKTLVGNGSYEIRVSVPTSVVQQAKIGDTDLLLLSYFNEPGSLLEPQMPSKDVPHCFAKVKEVKHSASEQTEMSIRVDDPPIQLHNVLVLSTELQVLKIGSMITIEREYAALKATPYYNLKTNILTGEPAQAKEPDPDTIARLQKSLDVNESQARAISCSNNTSGFSLIQGPPGTGKTKTILGIVGSFLTTPKSSGPPPVTANAQTIASYQSKSDIDEPGSGQRRLLICAPSNAAVDELVLRFKDGIRGYDGRMFKPNVVRLGRTDAINSNLREFTLEELVDKKLESIETQHKEKFDGDLRKKQNEQLAKREELRKQKGNTPVEQEELIEKIKALTRKIKETGHKLDMQRESVKVSIRTRDIERRKFQAAILQGANIVCATLSGSAHNVLLQSKMYFETVIIDEAAQSVELSALIPLKYGCKQCIMVGDPNQLPPTVLSQEAANLKYEQSLFVRMFTNFPDRVHMLNTQFRMHPEISRFPSNEFYNSRLKDGPLNHVYTKREWHLSDIFGPYRFFDVAGQQAQSKRTKSLFNTQEVGASIDLYKLLEDTFGKEFMVGKVGVISPYKEQVNLIRRSFMRKFGDSITKTVDFNTIDGFQGQEKDIIIMSCVRASSETKGVGFLGDIRRMNVAITRAKSSLWIIGNEKSLVGNGVWKRLLDDARSRNLITHVTNRFFNSPEVHESLKKAAEIAATNMKNGTQMSSVGASSGPIVPGQTSASSVDGLTNPQQSSGLNDSRPMKRKNSRDEDPHHSNSISNSNNNNVNSLQNKPQHYPPNNDSKNKFNKNPKPDRSSSSFQNKKFKQDYQGVRGSSNRDHYSGTGVPNRDKSNYSNPNCQPSSSTHPSSGSSVPLSSSNSSRQNPAEHYSDNRPDRIKDLSPPQAEKVRTSASERYTSCNGLSTGPSTGSGNSSGYNGHPNNNNNPNTGGSANGSQPPPRKIFKKRTPNIFVNKRKVPPKR